MKISRESSMVLKIIHRLAKPLSLQSLNHRCIIVVVVLYSPNTNRYMTDTCKTNNSIKHIWQVAREALVLSQLITYS